MKILFCSDGTQSTISTDLEILFPGKVNQLNFIHDSYSLQTLNSYSHIITSVGNGDNLEKLNYNIITDYANAGGQVISCLLEYAHNRGFKFSKTHVLEHDHLKIQIIKKTDVTCGFDVGDTLGWFGMVSDAPDERYANQMIQRQILGIKASPSISILATSEFNGGAVIIEEMLGKGRIVAMDLLSPLRPFYNSKGSTNKYLFLGNIINKSVRYGKHYPKRLGYEAFTDLLFKTSEQHPKLSVQSEGCGSDGRPLYSLNIGDASNPSIYFGAAIHGWEWESAYGLLRLAEILCENPAIEGLETRKLYYKILPVQNPWGFDHFTRQNAQGVDLNRNFDCAWDGFQYNQDLKIPWDYNYKGGAAASEQETQIIQKIITKINPRCVIDFHTAHYIMVPAHKGDRNLVESIHSDIKSRLQDRYITQKPLGGPYQQVNMDRLKKPGSPYPGLIFYAAERGVPAAFVIEMSGDRDDVHALVMNTDTVVEICLATIKNCLSYNPNTTYEETKS